MRVSDVVCSFSKYCQYNAKGNNQKLSIASKIIEDSFDLKNSYPILKKHNLDVFLVGSKQNASNTYGCYIVTRDPNNYLYISTAALKSDYKNTKTGYEVIGFVWNNILKYANENKIKTLILDVESRNKNLIKMYKKFGFTIQDKYFNILDFKHYYRMARPVDASKPLEYKHMTFISKLKEFWNNLF